MSIATRIESISNHLENAYNSLENIGVDLTNIDKNINNLSTQIESVYNDLPKTTATDTNKNIELNNTRKGKIKWNLKSNDTFQTRIVGKNFLDTLKETTEYKGLTITPNTDGSLKISGTASGGIILSIVNPDNICVLPAGTYTKSIKVVGTITKNNTNVLITGRNSNDTNVLGDTGISSNTTSSTTKTLDAENTMSKIQLYVSEAGAYFDCTIYVQIEARGSRSEWEPYVNRTPSPNPDNLQNIETVTGNNTFIIEGKNIFNVNQFLNTTGDLRSGIRTSIDEEGNVIMKGTGSDNYAGMLSLSLTSMPWLNGKKLKVSTTSDNNHIGIYLRNPDGYNSSITYDSSKNLELMMQVTSAMSYEIDETFKIQIEIGETATTYEQYQSQSYPINLGNIELCKIGSLQDKIFKANTHDDIYNNLTQEQKNSLVLNKWYKYGVIEKTTLSGASTEGWATTTTAYAIVKEDKIVFNTTLLYSKLADNGSAGATINPILCDSFLSIGYSSNTGTFTDDVELITSGNTYRRLMVCIKKSRLEGETVNDFKTWLSSHNLSLYYATRTEPTFTEITDSTLINQLEALAQAKSYNDKTNIHQINSSLPFVITASALSQNNS